MVAELFRLPDKLRNAIYTLVHTSKGYIHVSLNSNEPFSLRVRDSPGSQVLHSFKHLCSINNQIRQEARRFFFNADIFDCEVRARNANISL